MNVLIAFVTKSDPWPEEKGKDAGPAGTVTAVKALRPEAVYLLHTNETVDNMQKTKAFLEKDIASPPRIIHEGFKLDLSDSTDYQRLKDVIPPVLRKIAGENPGKHLNLVSGLTQPRIIFALSLSASVLNGALWEVNPPKENPWPKDQDGYMKRMECLDLRVISYFRELAKEKSDAIRLHLNLTLEEAYLDKDKKIGIRRRGERGVEQPRSFQMLVLLAAKTCYTPEGIISKKEINEHIYKDTESPDQNIPDAVTGINGQAKRLTSKSKLPLDKLIISPAAGVYRLCDELRPGDEKIKFTGDLERYLTDKLRIKKADLRDYFPGLGVS